MAKFDQSKYIALIAATGLLTMNFWAWSLLSPLATQYAEQLVLSPLAVSLLVAAPVLIGSLGRIPVGLLTDRYGGRRVFASMCVVSGLAVLNLAVSRSYLTVLMAAFGIGIAGASFAVGVPFVSAWFSRKEQGFALGIYAVGNAGTAVAGILTPRLIEASSRSSTFMAIAGVLLVLGVAMAIKGRDAPKWRPATTSAMTRLRQAATWKSTWPLAALYAITFGAFVALGLYLPVLLNRSYGLMANDAAFRAAGFVLLATGVRPLGGWLSDRLGGVPVLRYTFFAICVFATVAAFGMSLVPFGTLVYLGLATALGISSGSIFAILGHTCKEENIGVVSGIVGAVGGLGGFFPPLLLGASYQLFGVYSPALLMLAIVALVIFLNLQRLLGVQDRLS